MNEIITLEPKKAINTDNRIIPITLKQLLTAKTVESKSSSVLLIDGRKAKHISVVAQIIGIVEDQISIFYEIEDGTGTFAVQLYKSTDTLIEEFEMKQYIYVVGRMATSAKKGEAEPVKIIMAYSMQAVSDANQIAMHMIQAIYVHKLALKENSEKKDFLSTLSDYDDVESSPRSLTQIKNSPTTKKLSPEEKIENINQSIINLLKNIDGNGLNQNEIIKSLSARYSISDIMTSLDSMSYQGIVVNTISSDYYAIA